MSDLINSARTFAIAAHESIDHRRKYTNEPYFNHSEAVAEIVKSVPHTDEMIAAAYLHDVIEDVPGIEYPHIAIQFGVEVASLVHWLTHITSEKDGNRETRMHIERKRLAKAPAEAQTIKVADLIDNTRSIVAHDPKFAKVYLTEKAKLLAVLTKADSKLLELAWKQEAMARLRLKA